MPPPARTVVSIRRSLRARLLFAAILPLALAACQKQAPVEAPPAKPRTVVASGGEDSGALSSDAAAAGKATLTAAVLKGTKWPRMQVTSGEARISCDAGAPVSAEAEANPPPAADGAPLTDLNFLSVADALRPCMDTGTVRLRYAGKISGDFTALVQRVAAMADRMGIEHRILDIDSTGGRLEDAMPAGDAIAESHWTIRVRKDAICHSACVLVLAAGDDREIAGRIGIHRMIRVGSKADTRAELSQELREVYGELKDYLERNGASVAVADLMMTVPNRSLRLLTDTELQEYGLSGANAVQDDLDRIRLARKCGDDFVKRKDAYLRDYASQCPLADRDEDALRACGAALRERYGFPDAKCAAESPVAEPPSRNASAAGEPAADGRAAGAGTASGETTNGETAGNSAPAAATTTTTATGRAAPSAAGGAAGRR